MCYWTGRSEPPCLTVAVNARRLTVSHHPPLVDPTTGTQAALSVAATALDVEHLLVKAISFHTRSLLGTTFPPHAHQFRLLMQDHLFRRLKENDELALDDVELTVGAENFDARLIVSLAPGAALFITVNTSTGQYLVRLPACLQVA